MSFPSDPNFRRAAERSELSTANRGATLVPALLSPAMRTFVRVAGVCWLGWFGAVAVRAQPAAAERRALNPSIATLAAKIELVPGGRAKLSLTPKLGPAAQYKLHDAAGKEVAATISADGAIEALVDAKSGYILTPRETKRQPLATAGVQFPARYIMGVSTGTPNLGGLFLRPARVPLTWDENEKAYATQLVVGYEFQDGAERDLAQPKTITFFAEGPQASIISDTVVIDRSGGGGYKRVTLITKENQGETLFTARAGPADELKSSITVRREPGSLQLALPSTEIAAYGVGSGKLTVTLLARDGRPIDAEEPLAIQLSSRRLRLPAMVTVPARQNAAEAEFRSAGFGEDRIVAQSGRLEGAQVVRLIFPVAAVVAAVAGGALGGGTRYLRHRRNPRKHSPLLVRRLLEGILVGVIFVGAAWAGLVTANFSSGILGTPFGAFVLAALSGYVGCVLLDRLTKRTFKALDADG